MLGVGVGVGVIDGVLSPPSPLVTEGVGVADGTNELKPE